MPGLSAVESSKKLVIMPARWSAAGELLRLRRSTNSKSGSVTFADFTADDRDIELALVETRRDVGTDTEFDLQPDCGIAGRELPEQGRQNVEIEIVGCADPDWGVAIAAQTMLGFLVRREDAPRVGQKNLAILSQPDAARIGHDQARADLVLKTFDVQTHGRLGEIHVPRRLGKAAGVAYGYEGS